MTESRPTVRIFISSPGDVTEEREGAKRVVEGLRRLYPGAELETVLWEELALPATASFQETIDFLLEREPIDIAVFILWSRLGSPLGTAITKADGSPYRSGTEREFDLMLTAFEQSGRKRPVILAYVRDDDTSFKKRLAASPKSELHELIEQQQLAESFVVEQFHDAEGRNLRAYQSYREPIGFREQLKGHLRRALDDLLEIEQAATWTEDPYRGLETFDVEHAPIFYGRDEETCDLLQRLRDQRRERCAFVVIVAASGSGKSSLARAGVAASLVQGGDDEGTVWQVRSFIPALSERSLCHTLARTLADVLPDLAASDDAVERIAKGLGENASLTVELTIGPAFEQSDKPFQLLLILDQMEELWTDRNTTEEDREQFLDAVAALAESGHVSVLATLRSDFYAHAQRSPTFLKLKGERGHYDLLPPDAGSIHRLITEPARLAGLGFERNEKTGKSLDEVIWEDASGAADALPLLEYTLSELYRQRDEKRQLMTFAAYVELGGVEGAIGKRADETFASLPAEAQAALDEILPLLVSVDVAGEQSGVRRRASLADLTANPARKVLTERLIADRFLTTDREGETAVASLAHEALLRSWVRIVNWVNVNREQLRLRARVEQSQQRWEQQGRDESLLLAAGVPLDEGRQLIEEAPYLLNESTTDYIHASIDHHKQSVRKSRRVRTAVLSTVATLLAAMMIGGVVAWQLNRQSVAEGRLKQLLAAEASGLEDAIEELRPYQELVRADLLRFYEGSSDASKEKLHSALSLLDDDESVLPYLAERLLTVPPPQFSPILELLHDHGRNATEKYWQIALDESQPADRRFRSACALAQFESEISSSRGAQGEDWQDREFTDFVTDYLVNENSLRISVWVRALEPARRFLIPSLAVIYRGDPQDRASSEIELATNVLEQYAADDPQLLAALLLDAQPKQLDALFDEFAAHKEQAVSLMEQALRPDSETASLEKPNRAVALRQSRAATVLLRMGKVDPILELIQRDLEQPEAMTQFVHRCRASGVNPNKIWQCLSTVAEQRARVSGQTKERKKLDRAMYGMMLALGEFDRLELPAADRTLITDQLIAWYSQHPSSAVHGAAGWLLRHWGFDVEVNRVDQTPIPFDETFDRDWYVLRVTPREALPPASGTGFFDSLLSSNHSQLPEPIYFTMIVFAPNEFSMGSPEGEAGRENDEPMRQIRLTRPLAVSDREMTWGQFLAYDQSRHHDAWEQQFGRELMPNDPVFGVNWFEAVDYCRWLTIQFGLQESEQFYSEAPLKNNRDSRPGWVELSDSMQWPVNPDANGFRLPTDAEWERVCRNATRATYSFGDDRELLKQYGWYNQNSGDWSQTTGGLRPNPRGLFDLHGNVAEWCHDWYSSDYAESQDPLGPDDGWYRAYRGGGWSDTAAECRSSNRSGGTPANRVTLLGFRLATTVPSSPASDLSAGERESESEPAVAVETEP